MRLGVGDEIVVVDGAGSTFHVELETLTGKRAVGRILSRTSDAGEPAQPIHASMALLKNASRWEVFIEKAVELGCTRITPLLTQRTLKVRFNRRRSDAILVAALKQSGRSRLPILDDPIKLRHLLKEKEEDTLGVICHEASLEAMSFSTVLAKADSGVSLLVGPEGGFTEEEVTLADDAGYHRIWLGARRLRAETAAIAALSVVSQFVDVEK